MATFPQAPLDTDVELNLAGAWTDISAYTMQRAGTSPTITISRGRPDETSSATASTCAMEWKNQDGRFSPRNPTGPYYGQLGRNTPVRVSVPDAGTYLRLADDATSFISAPDVAALQITGSIDVRVDCDLDNWQPSVLCSKWGATGRAWALALNGDGGVTFTWFDGTAAHQASTSGLAVMPLGRSMLRANLNTLTGQVQFFTAATMAGTQTLLATVAGAGATSVSAAAGQAVAVGDSSAYDATFGTKGCQGKIYEFQLYSGITLVADPVFTSQTAGATSFADAQSNTWTVAGTASLSNRSFRFHGEAASLPQNWDSTGADVWTPVTASGILRRLQQNTAPLKSAMRRAVTGAASGPSSAGTLAAPQTTLAYWPAEDPAGSTQIAPGISVNGDGLRASPMMLSALPAFQGTSGTPSADSTFACSAQLPQVGTSAWTGLVPGYNSAATAWSVEFLLQVPAAGTVNNAFLVVANFGGAANTVNLAMQYQTGSGGSFNLTVNTPTSVNIALGPNGVNGVAYWVQLANVGTGGTQAYLTLLPAGGGASAQVFNIVSDTGHLTSVQVNPAGVNLGATIIGQVWCNAAFSTTSAIPAALPSLTRMANVLNAWAGETAASRAARLCTENGIAPRVYGYPAASAPMGVQTIDTLANLLKFCEDTDRGMIYEPAECLGIGYRTLASLCNQAPAVMLDYSQAALGGDGSGGLVPVDDDAHLVNDAVVTRSGGSSYQFQVTSGPLSISAPPAGAGDYQGTLTVYCAYDSQVAHIAGWMAHTGTANAERYPVIPLNLARSELASLIYAIQSVRTGGNVAVLNPPSWLPPGAITQIVYGTQERLGGFFWLLSWNAVPELPYEVAAAGIVPARWSFAVSGTPTSSFFSVTTGQSASISAGDTFTDTKNPGVTFTVTAVSVPFGGFVAITFTPPAAVVMSSPDTVTQVTVTAHADTAGSQLASGVASGVTSLSVTVNAGDLWTTAAGDMPFDIQIGGERCTVTAITGSSSPQTFTVTRSVNGVVKAQTAGAAISLWNTPAAALAGAA